MSGECRGAAQLPESPKAPHTHECLRAHTHTHAQHSAGLTYSREGHKSLDKKAGGWGELVGFLNQDVKAHLGKRKQKTAWCCSHLWEEGTDGGGERKSSEAGAPPPPARGRHPRP